jgi:hypothetical protein
MDGEELKKLHTEIEAADSLTLYNSEMFMRSVGRPHTAIVYDEEKTSTASGTAKRPSLESGRDGCCCGSGKDIRGTAVAVPSATAQAWDSKGGAWRV